MFCSTTLFALLAALVLALPSPGSGATTTVLFHDDFDSQPDWSPPQEKGAIECRKGGEDCPLPIPKGYYDYRVGGLQRCSNRDGRHNTLNIDDRHPRGGKGKSLLVWNEPCYSESGSWGSDGLLGIEFPPQNEVYVRYWVLFQPEWRWATGASPQQKFLHLSHHDASRRGGTWDFFSGAQNKPRAIPQLAKWGNGSYRVQLMWVHSPLTAARDNSASFNTNDYLRPKPFDWLSPGGPGDGGWHCFEFYARLNSSGGAADGISRTWYDGDLVHDSKDVVWIPAGDKPEKFGWNHAWLGGNNANIFPGDEQWYAIDDVVVSTRYSGPPPRPEDLEARLVDASTVKLTWSPGKNGENYQVDGYRLHYGTAPDRLEHVKNVGKETAFRLTDIPPGQPVYFAVTAYNRLPFESRDNESGRSRLASVPVGRRSRD